jgi:hypothetical protein
MQTSQEQTLTEIEALCRSCLKSKTMTDANFVEVAILVQNEQPRTQKQMLTIVKKYLPSNMATESQSE